MAPRVLKSLFANAIPTLGYCLAACIFLAASRAEAAPSFAFSVTAPAKLEGAPGATLTFDANLFLTSANDDPTDPEGSQGWSFGLAATGATITSIVVEGLVVSTIYDADGKEATPPVDPAPFDLASAAFQVAEPGTGDYVGTEIPGINGVISAIVLSTIKKRTLHPNSVENVARISVETTVPLEGCAEVRLFFIDFLQGTGVPVKSVVTYRGHSIPPVLGSSTLQVCAPIPTFDFSAAPVGFPTTPQPDGSLLSKPTVLLAEGQNPLFEFDAEVHLDSDSKTVEGPQAWSVSIAHQPCLELLSEEVGGQLVGTLYDSDHNPGTPLVAVPMDLNDADFEFAQTGMGLYPGSAIPSATGAISAVVLNQTVRRVLPGHSSTPILKLHYRYLAPIVEGQNPDCLISFLDGLQGTALPVDNVITVNGKSQPATLHNLTVRPQGVRNVTSSFIRGDPSDDGKVDIADAIAIVSAVVPSLGGPPLLCLDSGDVNLDGRLDLVDAVYLLDYEFRSQAAPPSPFPSCGRAVGSTAATCPMGSLRHCH